MIKSSPLIGFDRLVLLSWSSFALEVASKTITVEDLRSKVGESLPGKESQRKTVDIVKRLWLNPFSENSDFIGRGVVLYQNLGKRVVLPLTWGSAISTYPFFGRFSEISGRLLTLQGDYSIKEIQRRMAEVYGDRSGIVRAVARVLQSQADWGTLDRVDKGQRMVKRPPIVIDNEELTAWLIEAAIRYAGKPLAVSSLQSLPVLYPFLLTQPVAYLASNSKNLELRSEGPSNQFVAIRI